MKNLLNLKQLKIIPIKIVKRRICGIILECLQYDVLTEDGELFEGSLISLDKCFMKPSVNRPTFRNSKSKGQFEVVLFTDDKYVLECDYESIDVDPKVIEVVDSVIVERELLGKI